MLEFLFIYEEYLEIIVTLEYVSVKTYYRCYWAIIRLSYSSFSYLSIFKAMRIYTILSLVKEEALNPYH